MQDDVVALFAYDRWANRKVGGRDAVVKLGPIDVLTQWPTAREHRR